MRRLYSTILLGLITQVLAQNIFHALPVTSLSSDTDPAEVTEEVISDDMPIPVMVPQPPSVSSDTGMMHHIIEDAIHEESAPINESVLQSVDVDMGTMEELLPLLENLIPSQQLAILDNPDLWYAPRYKLELDITDDLKQVHGHETIHYTNRTGEVLEDIGLLFLPNVMGGVMEVRNLRVNNMNPVGWHVEGNRQHGLRVDLAEALVPQDHVTLSFEYTIDIPEDVTIGYGLLALQDNILSLGHAYGLIAAYDEDWHLASPSLQGDLLHSEAGFFDVTVRAPQGLVLASSGRVTNETKIEEENLITIISGPVRDFFISASYDYDVVEKVLGEYRLRSFYLQSGGSAARSQAEKILQTSSRAITFFSSLFPLYPYRQFDIVPLQTSALGMEFPGIIAMNTGFYTNDSRMQGGNMRTRLENTTVHEVAHQWFYNMVGNDQQTSPWLDEAPTQYITLLYHQNNNPNDYDYYVNDIRRRAGSRVVSVDNSVASYGARSYVTTIYGMAPVRFLDIESHIGQDIFVDFLNDYVQRYQWKQADPDDFFALLFHDYVSDVQEVELRHLLDPWFELP